MRWPARRTTSTAAVATALSQTVVDPLMCGIAGFGTGGVYMPGKGVHEYFDFHSPAPLAALANRSSKLARRR